MQACIEGNQAFRYITFDLDPGESVITESGAMASMSAELDLTTKLNGGIFRGLARKYLGSESLFVNEFKNTTQQSLRLTLTSQSPGDIRAVTLQNESLNLEGGAYICSTPGISLQLRYAGVASFLAREGLFKLVVSGTGTVWFGGYGAFIEKDLQGEYIVDSGHLVAYQPSIQLRTQLSNGIFGSLFSGEGLVTRLEGSGKVWLQSRSLGGLASWINPHF